MVSPCTEDISLHHARAALLKLWVMAQGQVGNRLSLPSCHCLCLTPNWSQMDTTGAHFWVTTHLWKLLLYCAGPRTSSQGLSRLQNTVTSRFTNQISGCIQHHSWGTWWICSSGDFENCNFENRSPADSEDQPVHPFTYVGNWPTKNGFSAIKFMYKIQKPSNQSSLIPKRVRLLTQVVATKACMPGL